MPILTLEEKSHTCHCVPIAGLINSHSSALCHREAELGSCTRVGPITSSAAFMLLINL